MRATTINIAMIHWQVWLTILLIILVNTIRILVFSTSTVSSFVVVDACVLWGVMIWIFYLRLRLMFLMKTLSGPATYGKYCRTQADAAEAEEEEEEEAEKDEEEAKHHEDNRIMNRSCCFSKTQPTPQQSLFPCSNPSSITRGLQLALLLICISVPLYFMELIESIQTQPVGTKVITSLCIVFPALALLILAIPAIITRFVIVSSVASMSRPSQIRSTIEKYHRTLRKQKHGHGHKHEHEHGHEHGHGHEHEHGHEHGHGHEHDEHGHDSGHDSGHEHHEENEPGGSEHPNLNQAEHQAEHEQHEQHDQHDQHEQHEPDNEKKTLI